MNNLVWWTGVVENRDDPEQLGRCKVRIFGYHTEDVSKLPTNDLPWAIPMQPVTSAATSGVGVTPVGLVTGSWVMGFFLDGEEAQKPVIMGTVAGKPQINVEASEKQTQDSTATNTLTDSRGNIVYDNYNKPRLRTDTTQEDYYKPLLDTDVNKVLDALSLQISGGDYTKESDTGELGKYQVNVSTLVDLGYVKRPQGGIIDPSILNDNTYWTGKNGAKNKEVFLNNTAIQEKVAQENFKKVYDTLVRLVKVKETDDRAVVAGLVSAGMVVGAKNADKLDKKNEAGEKTRTYFTAGNAALGGDATEFFRQYEEAGNYLPDRSTASLTNEDLAKVKGFQDPNKKYPKYEYTGLSDLNKLAVGNRSHLSLQIKDNKKVEKIPLANSSQTWDEPETAYGGVYPYNQVIEAEAGHVVEFDSTPGAERIHLFHKSGSYIEIDVNGSSVRKVVGENYEVFDRNNFVYVKGAQCLTVDGKTSILVRDNCNIEVDGDLKVTGHGQVVAQAAGNMAVIAEAAIVTAKNSLEIVSEGAINMQGKEINLYAKGGSVSIKGNKDVNLQSGTGGVVSIKGGLSILMDAVLIKSKMGANLIKALALDILKPPTKKTPNTTQVPVLPRRTLNDDSFALDGGESEAGTWSSQREAAGAISKSIVPFADPADLAAPNATGNGKTEILTGNCAVCEQFNNSFPRSFKLSKNFTLGHVLVGKYGPALVAQRGLEEKQIVCNLINLAENCLEPIKAKYPDMVISSGFRNRNPVTGGVDPGDHGIGCAVDLWFPRPISDIKAIADWISQNVPYRQLLLEYETYDGSNKIRTAWIHLALQLKDGKLVKSTKPPVMTFLNHASAYSKLVNLA